MYATLAPNHARAFWFFSTDANAATGASVPSTSTPTLRASINLDPNPDKGLGASIQMSGNAMVAYAGPSGTIADVAGSSVPDRISVHVVRPGDTLSEIADMFGVSVNTIIWANNLKSAGDVHVGNTLAILPISGVEHTVVKGDTLKSIAKKYNGDTNEIAQYNGLDPATLLSVGSTLIIPGGDITPPASKAKKVPLSRSAMSRILAAAVRYKMGITAIRCSAAPSHKVCTGGTLSTSALRAVRRSVPLRQVRSSLRAGAADGMAATATMPSSHTVMAVRHCTPT